MTSVAGAPVPEAIPATTPTVTGVLALDRELVKGPPTGPVLLLHEPAIDAVPLLKQAVASWIAAGGTAVYATTAKDPVLVEADYTRLGFNVDDLQAHGRILDLREVPDSAEAIRRLRHALDDDPRRLLVLDSLTGLVHLSWGQPFETWFPQLLDAIGARRSLLQFNESVGPDLVAKASTQAAAVVRVAARQFRDHTFPSARVVALGHRPVAAPRTYPFRVSRPGGVQAHLAKVIVTGPHNSGKSSFVHAVSPAGVSVERLGTTVALDHGQAEFGGVHVEVVGTPGQERFDPIIRQCAQGAVGVLVMLDSTRPETFQRADEIRRLIAASDLPAVFVANKQDAGGAVALEDIRRRLQLPEGTPLLPCVATDPSKARTVLHALVERVLTWQPPEPWQNPDDRR